MFNAKKVGVCTRCPEPIEIGQPISWNRRTGEAWHVSDAPLVTPTGDKLATLEAALRDVVAGMSTPSVAPLDEDRVRAIAQEVAGTVSKRVDISVGNAPAVTVDNAHYALPELLRLVSIRGLNGHRQNVYMHGPAGSGKSTGARQAADVLSVQFAYMSCNPMMPDSRIMGYYDANGRYVPSLLFKLYTEGGLYCFDEIDNASASFVTTLNALLENGHGAFPHGMFPRHPDFVCVCTANTIGRGGDIHYPERRALDGAFLDRFLFLPWEQDDALTANLINSILGADKGPEFLAWAMDASATVRAKHPTVIISPRAYIQGALMERNGVKRDAIISSVISRGLSC